MLSVEYIGESLFIFTIVFIPIQISCVFLRFLSRHIVKKLWELDDYVVIVSLIFQLLQAGLCIGALKHAGVGYHETYLLLKTNGSQILETWGKYLVAVATIYWFSANMPKIAILILYRNLFPQRYLRFIVYGVMGVLIGASTATTIVSLAACDPFAANWNPKLPSAKCIDKEEFYRWGSLPNIVTDLAMLLIPIPVVWRLHTSTKMKIGLTITFVIGSMGLVTSIIRLTTFFQKNSFLDGTYTAIDLLIWTQVEPGIYLIAACLSTCRPLIDRISPRRHRPKRNNSEGKTRSSSGYVRQLGSRFRTVTGQSRDRVPKDSVDAIPLKDKSTESDVVTGLGHSKLDRGGFHRLNNDSHSQNVGDIIIKTDIRVDEQEHNKHGLQPGRSVEAPMGSFYSFNP